MRLLPFSLAILAMLFSFSCTRSCGDSQKHWEVNNVDKLSATAVFLSQKYKRSRDNNSYSLYYKAKHPNTIVIQVKYSTEAEKKHVQSVAEQAEGVAKKIAEEKFELKINTEIDMQPGL
jgi:hypothetical protein